jgi:hypothetical protein
VRIRNELQHVIDALDNTAAELERLRVLMEY